MDNAIKFTPRGGRVTVQARLFADDPNFVCVAVSDTGCGINAQHQQRIFERLFQASNPGGARIGLGLGLYISKDLVSRQGGRIWVESHPGRGSTFFFTLPVFSLARQIRPLLTRRNLPESSIALIIVELFPREEHSPTAHDTGAAEVAR
jgi:signal transduction histidine kinase